MMSTLGINAQVDTMLSPLTGLTELNLRVINWYIDPAEDELADFPAAICGLTQLQDLSVWGRDAPVHEWSIPDSFSQLTALTQLALGNMQLLRLPDSLRHLTALERVQIWVRFDNDAQCGFSDNDSEVTRAILPPRLSFPRLVNL